MTSELPTHELAAVVVNYNAGSALSECVASLERAGVKSIVVVDNGSTDGSLEGLGAPAHRFECFILAETSATGVV